MTTFDQIVNATEIVSKAMEEASKEEKKYGHELCNVLEVYSWELFRMKNNLKEIREVYGP